MSKEIRENLDALLQSWPFSGTAWQKMLSSSRLTLSRRYQLAKGLSDNKTWDVLISVGMVLQLLVFTVGFFFVIGGFDTLSDRNGIDPGTSRGAALILSGIIVSWVGGVLAWLFTAYSRRIQRWIGIAEGLLEANRKPEKKPTKPKSAPEKKRGGAKGASKRSGAGSG